MAMSDQDAESSAVARACCVLKRSYLSTQTGWENPMGGLEHRRADLRQSVGNAGKW